jgi:hypothetical protein
VNYNAIVVKSYIATNSIARFQNKKLFFPIVKTLYLTTTLALNVDANSKVVGLGPAPETIGEQVSPSNFRPNHFKWQWSNRLT